MIRNILAALAFVTLAAPAFGQTAGRKPAAPDSAAAKYAGVWKGKYFSDHAPENQMTITIKRDAEWHAVMELVAEHPVPPLPLDDFAAVGNKLTWTEEVMGGRCNGSATLIGADLKGEIKCGDMAIGFLLKKQ